MSREKYHPHLNSWQPGVTQRVSLSLLDPHPYQPTNRVTPRAIDELQRMYRESGELTPITICKHPEKKGRYAIVSGHCRVEVAKREGLDHIWCVFTNKPEVMIPGTQDTNKLTPAQVFNSWARHPRDEQEKYLKGLRKRNLSSGYIRRIIEHLGWAKAVRYGRLGVKPSYIMTAHNLHHKGLALFLNRVPSTGDIFEWLVSSPQRGSKGAEISAMKRDDKHSHEKLFSAVRANRDYGKRKK